MYFSPCVLTLLWDFDDLLVKMPVSCLHNRYISCKWSVQFGHCEQGQWELMALYYCCCWRIASKKTQLPRCRGRNAGVGNISIWGSSVFWEEVRGAGVPSSPVGAPRQCRQELLPVPLPARCLAAQHPAAHGGSRGSEGGSEAICSHVTFPTSKLCFYNYWPCLPQELWPAQQAVLFHICQQWVFSLCSCRKAFVSCLSSPAARCAGQAACHVLESLLSTPLPCAAAASRSACRANTH